MNDIILEINSRLEEIISNCKDGLVKDAMLYSIKAGGKRIRPYIFIQTLRSFQIDYHPYIDIACAIEMIHTYSLIHDDLPGMDNDDLRRGQPTCHKKFDEATAILAGDALLNESMNVMLQLNIDDTKKIQLMKELFQSSGLNGMIYGQQQDMYFENYTANINDLEDIHHYKTGCLLSVPFVLAGIIADSDSIEALRQLGFDLGLAFQIQDDIFDVLSDTETLGKTVGSDINNNKTTYVSLLGLENSKDYADKLFKQCLSEVYNLTINHGLMIQIIEKVMKRVN